jgi:hypothetical protein
MTSEGIGLLGEVTLAKSNLRGILKIGLRAKMTTG